MDRSFAGQCARHLTLRCRVPNIALLELEKKFSRRRRAWRIASSSKPSLSESSSVLRPTSSLDIFASLDCEGTTRDEWLFNSYRIIYKQHCGKLTRKFVQPSLPSTNECIQFQDGVAKHFETQTIRHRLSSRQPNDSWRLLE